MHNEQEGTEMTPRTAEHPATTDSAVGGEATEPSKADSATETGPTASTDPDDGARSAVPDGSAETELETPPKRVRRSISVSVRSIVVAVVVVVLAATAGTLAWLYIGAREQLAAQATSAADDSRAEKLALDYAVNAATMNFKDLQGWKVKLVAGTNEELNKKLSDAAQSMEQVLVPLEWTSTAEPLVAKVRSKTDGVLTVDCFVSVQTKTVQAPEPLQSTATYAVTVNSNDNWVITDVGGIGSVIGPN